MMEKARLLTVTFSLCLGLITGCASGYSASHPLYDFDSVFLNGDMRGQLPWKAPDRAALREALQKRASGARGPKGTPRTRQRLEPDRAPRVSTQASEHAPRALPNHISAHVAERPLGEIDDTKAPSRLKGVILGDGSARGELRAAAKRLVGMGPAITPSAFVQHLERAADVVLPRASTGGAGVAPIWQGLKAKGVTYARGERTPMAGDLVFFHQLDNATDTPQLGPLHSMGVVTEIVDEDTVLCIVPAMNAVRPIYLSPAYPNVRRRGEKIMNTPIRSRHRDEGVNAPRLSGQLLAGFARI